MAPLPQPPLARLKNYRSKHASTHQFYTCAKIKIQQNIPKQCIFSTMQGGARASQQKITRRNNKKLQKTIVRCTKSGTHLGRKRNQYYRTTARNESSDSVFAAGQRGEPIIDRSTPLQGSYHQGVPSKNQRITRIDQQRERQERGNNLE